MTQEMLILKKSYDFCKWLLHHTGKFPKSYRFSVAVRIERVEFTGILNQARWFYFLTKLHLPVLWERSVIL